MIYPYILEGGKILEIELPLPSGNYLRLEASFEAGSGHLKTFPKTLKRETFYFSVDQKRFVTVDVYIDVNFLNAHLDEKIRSELVAQFVQARSAWFYSYGIRRLLRD